MNRPEPARPSRRRMLLGAPVLVAAATLAVRPVQAVATTKPRVLECAADLMRVS